jgi:glycosyltransferase involved in cell wall biosynthesis
MATEGPLIIGYAGSLDFFDPIRPVRAKSGIRDWFWTYRHTATDPSTRSGYYLFLALKMLKEQFNRSGAHLQVHLWGNIHPGNRSQADEIGVGDMVRIEGYLPKEISIARSAACDMMFLPLESSTPAGDPLFIPGKLFEYLRNGKPVLALAGRSDCTEILRHSGLGAIFPPADTRAVAETLDRFISDRSLLEKYVPDNEYIGQYSFRNITRRLAGVFDDVITNK